MEGNLPSKKNQELNIRQSFLHLNNSNSKACVKILFWKYLTALSTIITKKKQYISFKQTNKKVYEQKLGFQNVCGWLCPHKTRGYYCNNIQVFRYCRSFLSYWNGTQLWNNNIKNYWSFLMFPLHHSYARPLCIFSAYIYYCIYQSYWLWRVHQSQSQMHK